MVMFGGEAGGSVRSLSLIHATRVLLIIMLAPILLNYFYDVDLAPRMGDKTLEIPLIELVLMAAAAVIGWKGGERIGLFGAPMLGPLILATFLSLSGLLHTKPPEEAILAAQLFIGIGIGVHYVGVTMQELRHDVLAGTGYVFLLALLAAGFTWMASLLQVASPVALFLAYAPGGQSEMLLLAFAVGADLGFVVIHHLTRIMLIILLAPFIARFLPEEHKQ